MLAKGCLAPRLAVASRGVFFIGQPPLALIAWSGFVASKIEIYDPAASNLEAHYDGKMD